MNKKLFVISTIILLIGVAFAPSINADVRKQDLDVIEEDYAIPLEFELQRIRDLVQSINLRKIIVNPYGVVDTLEEISSILEEEDVRNYIEKTSDEDCGCEDDNSGFEWYFPTICTLLYPLWALSIVLLMLFSGYQFFWFMEDLGKELECFWVRPWYPFVYIS